MRASVGAGWRRVTAPRSGEKSGRAAPLRTTPAAARSCRRDVARGSALARHRAPARPRTASRSRPDAARSGASGRASSPSLVPATETSPKRGGSRTRERRRRSSASTRFPHGARLSESVGQLRACGEQPNVKPQEEERTSNRRRRTRRRDDPRVRSLGLRSRRRALGPGPWRARRLTGQTAARATLATQHCCRGPKTRLRMS